jgi:hypothetical protein
MIGCGRRGATVKRTRWLLLLLLLVSPGCARRDWTDLLVLTDVTGTWTGRMDMGHPSQLMLILHQQGARVVGTSSLGGAGTGFVQWRG